MKKTNIKLALLIGLFVSLYSCSDFLEPDYKSEKNPEDIFSTPQTTNGAIMGIYQSMTENRSYRNRLIGYMGVNTDIETHSGSKNVATGASDRKALAVYQISASMSDGFNDANGNDPWSRIYTGIERANQAVTYINQYGNPNPETNPEMAYYLAEALTLRAFFYNDLIKIWGDVPNRFEPLNISKNNLYIPKVDRDIIYLKILEDLDLAEKLAAGMWADKMPRNPGTTQRVSLGFIKALKARIALQAAGYSMRKRSENGTAEIVQTLPEHMRDSLYRVAKQACLDIVSVEGTASGYKLHNSFEDIFKQQCQYNVSSGREAIFQLPFSKTRGEYLSYLGLRREFDKLKEDDYIKNITIKNEVSVVPSFFYDYDPSDTRRDVTIAPYKWVDGVQVMTAVNNFNLAKWRAEWLKADSKLESNDDGVSFIVIRYADVLLMLAETINHLEGPSNAIKYLEQVRSRAFGGNPNMDLILAKYPAYKSDKEEFLKALIDERAFEFCGENIRKWDLMRWGILKDKLDEAKKHIAQLRNSGTGEGDAGTYATVPSKVFWKWSDNSKKTITIYGLNRNEHDSSDKTSENGWTSKAWTSAVESASNNSLLDQKAFVEKVIYKEGQDPIANQLLPIMNVVIVGSQGSLTNDPLTNWPVFK